ncbi:hypothetical protein FHS43_006027 [Streptosporangium becharense]|uniref:Uncharacterized protein n=1 Tax=Streptosporangium becharense TaxID=1816182 RepID=A0A7W9IIW4_9ACTN|nr:hypothetical protein [Streptosporangium becharense]MBB2914715.1 hypothetical protein [Streptosporangium becharense]MBB5820884.1 hypothetical protein [Streptosporangium becharense]
MSATINVIGNNTDGGNRLLGTGAGIVAVACVAVLTAHHFLRRRQ